MSHRTTTGRRVGALSGITALAFAGFALATAPSADAAQSAELSYTCSVPAFGITFEDPWLVTVEGDLPESVEPGATIESPAITATVTAGEDSVQTLRSLGNTEITEGTADAGYTVDGEQRSASLTVQGTPIPVPESGTLTVTATGTGESETAPETPGEVPVVIGDFTTALTTNTGFVAQIECSLNEGQDSTLATITVGDTGPEPSPSPTDSPTASPTDPSPTPTDPEPTDSPTASPTDPEPTDSPTATPTEPEPTDSPEPTDTATPTGTQEPSDPGQPTGPPVETGVVGEGDNATAAGVALLTISGAALAVATGRRRLRD
ncbi:hypothetical protein FB554_0050 [Barrientosiimonas humi]|uniref:DUF6801 domain-containing protein n=1 Tax=Barrientosiimonas humi TaxID=999931 RepID=A0A542X7X9_9MICO|nr:DUF6801 domain-containing protein [Barrientosiimonas humi]TQL31935.1 hypothetical protein FB554_0050 [Barrientosiimonas humi]CAG7571759.1 hypothetical protein BH39T_PBIAJDOK_00534 [Barrientosiimonas humi]